MRIPKKNPAYSGEKNCGSLGEISQPVRGRQSFDRAVTLAYDELRRRARALKTRDGSLTLNATALVHETWIRMVKSGSLEFQSEEHLTFKMIRAMRNVLVDAARYRAAEKRTATRAELSTEATELADALKPRFFDRAELVISVDIALDKLSEEYPEESRAFELHYFGGFTQEEIARLLRIGEKKVGRHQKWAVAWLGREISNG